MTTQDLREKIEDCLMMRVVTAKPLKWEFYEKETVDRLFALFTAEREELVRRIKKSKLSGLNKAIVFSIIYGE